jgi:YegS/Rv2252/BmrU family lipid kinase
MSSLILINPHAAGGRALKLLPSIQSWCQTHGINSSQNHIAVPETIASARAVLSNLPGNSRVVVVGGDGTLHQMLPGLLQGGHEVGLVPYGSGNDCARAWGLQNLSWQEALAFAMTGQSQGIDIGRVELNQSRSIYFHSSLTVGFDASVGNRALAGPKYLRGLPRYLLATLRELHNLRNWPLHVQADGQLVHEGVCLLASSLNTPTYGAGMPAVPHALIDDGHLNLLLASQFNRLQTLLMLPRLLTGTHLSHPRIKCASFKSALIKSAANVPVAADGETLGDARDIKLQVMLQALQVVKK